VRSSEASAKSTLLSLRSRMSVHFSATRRIDTYYCPINKYNPPIIIIASPHPGSQYALKAWAAIPGKL
jgi:hypothetical protein